MAYLENKQKTCAICQQEYHYQELRDHTSFGLRDLDTRPPGMMRNMIHLMVQKCPYCGYANDDISKNMDHIEKTQLQDPVYQMTLQDESINFAIKKCILAGMLCEKKNAKKAGMMYLKAAWLADDAKKLGVAKKMRSKAIRYLENALTENENEVIRLIIVDLYRRIGMFDEAREYAMYLLDNFGMEKYKVNILNYQIALCNQEDTLDHTIPGNYQES